MASNESRSAADGNSDSDCKLKCNICFELPDDPVVTRCGHLYCWICLHTWLQRGSTQCPVCKAGVLISTIVPVYGSGNTQSVDGKNKHAFYEGLPRTDKSEPFESASQPSEPIPERPRAVRPEPVASSYGTPSSWGMQTVQFGLFPFGIGLQFGSVDNTSSNSFSSSFFQRTSQEQQRSQFISTLLIFVGILVVFWSIFVDTLNHRDL